MMLSIILCMLSTGCLCPSKSCMLKPNQQCDILEVGFWRWLGYEDGALMNTVCPIIVKETSESSLTPNTWGHPEKTAVSKPGGRPSPDVEFASILIFDFPAPRTVRNKFLGFMVFLLQKLEQTKAMSLFAIQISSSVKCLLESS